MKPLSPNLETPICVQEGESSLNSIFILGDCVVNILTRKVVLKYGSSNLVKIPSIDCKVQYLEKAMGLSTREV